MLRKLHVNIFCFQWQQMFMKPIVSILMNIKDHMQLTCCSVEKLVKDKIKKQNQNILLREICPPSVNTPPKSLTPTSKNLVKSKHLMIVHVPNTTTATPVNFGLNYDLQDLCKYNTAETLSSHYVTQAIIDT